MSELTKALVRARKRLGGTVFKGGANAHHKYSYVGHEHVITCGARDALLAEGLVLEQRTVKYLCEVPAGKSGPALLWEGVHALVHESGEERLYTFSATTQLSDKSAFIASTGLDRTAILRILLLAGSSEEDPDHSVHDRWREDEQRGGGNGNGQHRQPSQQQQPAPPMIDALLDGLYKVVDPKELAVLQDQARACYRQLPGDGQAAVKKAVDYAIARVAQAEEDRKDAERVEAEIAREKALIAEAEQKQRELNERSAGNA